MGSAPGCWFVVLPDRDMPPDVVAGLRNRAGSAALRVVPHPSGRPWLIGRWSPEEVTVCAAGEVRLAVVGTCSLTAAELAVRARQVGGVGQVEAALPGGHGCFHVVASVAGHTYVRGSNSGQRRVFRAEVDGGTVCADRARTLALLTGAALDPGQLALRLAGGRVPHPLGGGAMWHGVHAVPPGHGVVLDPDGRVHTRRWWQPPVNELPLPEAAAGLRQALRQAVALRVRPGQVVGADLSGGMDSTSLCFLAAEVGARLVAVTLEWSAPTNQDRAYAAHAAQHLSGLDHLTFPSADLPAHFTGLDERQDLPDEPTLALRDRAQQQHLAEAMRSRGATWRLSGHGGDHVVQPHPAYLHELLRRSLPAGLRHTAGLRARHRWPLRATVRALFDRRSYAAWLSDTAAHLLNSPDAAAPLGWGARPQLPPWASAQAVELCREQLRTAARDAVPLADARGRHAWIQSMRQAGQAAGHLAHGTAAWGLPAHTPFCDDAVLDAALAARPHEAASPWSYKPLLAAAMDGLVPARVLDRTTKDHCGIEWQDGLRLHRRALAAWAEGSRLVAVGLADEEPLRRALLSPGLLTGGAAELEATLAAEAWLRDLEHHQSDHLTQEKHVEPTAP